MEYRYYICDVFTETRFGGNQLAVLPEASGLSTEQMQQIAREFNFSESSFVFPPKAGHTKHVRIFTPGHEVPFAGHPNVGTAFVLATTGAFGRLDASHSITFEEEAGIVAITIRSSQGRVESCELAAPKAFEFGPSLSTERVAAALSLAPHDIVTTTHRPQVASVGLAFLMVELKDRAALERARVSLSGLEAIAAEGIWPSVHMYMKAADDFDVRARMFAPLAGVPEDPATGSANCALGGLLAHYNGQADGSFSWRIAQGVEMGRPSTLIARAEKKNKAVVGTWVGGQAVLVSEGTFFID